MSVVLQSFPRAAKSYDQHATVQRELARWVADWVPLEHRGRAL